MSTGLLIPHIHITRLVRTLHQRQQEEQIFPVRMKSNDPNNDTADGENLSCKWQASALMAIHEMAEHLLVMYFELLYILSMHEY
jgi:histone H3/H4